VGDSSDASDSRYAEARLRVLLALTFTTGIVDATAFLALGGVFAAMMTGNVIFLGLGLSDSVDFSVLGPLLAILAYVLTSATAAALAGRTTGPAFGTPISNAVEIGLRAAATAVAAFATVEADNTAGYATLVLLAAAMSWRTTNVRVLGSVNVPTTVLNLTMIAGRGLAAPADLTPRALALAALLAGALAAGLLLKAELWVPLATATALSLLVGLALSRERASRESEV
jgi:uncharacterized membrane protein YoaK (UPF0700 family)